MAYWLFKCDPKRYRLTERVTDVNPTITWLVTRYKKLITPDDIVFFMESGKKRTIRAVVRVDAGPLIMNELDEEQQYWVERDTQARCRIRGTITHRVELPVEELKTVRGLENLSIFHGVQQGTNFRVTDSEGEILLSMIEGQAGSTRSGKCP